LRIGTFSNGPIELHSGTGSGSIWNRAWRPEARAAAASGDLRSLDPGTDLLIDDGKLRLEVLDAALAMPKHA